LKKLFVLSSVDQFQNSPVEMIAFSSLTVAERIRERSLLLDDLEEYTATVESGERDQS